MSLPCALDRFNVCQSAQERVTGGTDLHRRDAVTRIRPAPAWRARLARPAFDANSPGHKNPTSASSLPGFGQTSWVWSSGSGYPDGCGNGPGQRLAASGSHHLRAAAFALLAGQMRESTRRLGAVASTMEVPLYSSLPVRGLGCLPPWCPTWAIQRPPCCCVVAGRRSEPVPSPGRQRPAM